MKIDNTLVSNAFQTASNQYTKGQDADFKTQLEAAAKSDDQEEMKKVCHQFESIFVNMLLKQMRSTIPEGGLTEKSNATKTFESMFDEEMANQIADAGGLGIGDMIYEQFTKHYELSKDPINQEGSNDEHSGDTLNSADDILNKLNNAN